MHRYPGTSTQSCCCRLSLWCCERLAMAHLTCGSMRCQGAEYEGMKWTLWDRWVLEGDLTVQQVLDWFTVCIDD